MQALGTAILESVQLPQLLYGRNPGQSPHWDAGNSTSSLGRGALFLPLRYREPAAGAANQAEGQRNYSDTKVEALSTWLQEASSPAQGKQIIGDAVTSKLVEIFIIPAQDIEMTQPPASFGLEGEVLLGGMSVVFKLC